MSPLVIIYLIKMIQKSWKVFIKLKKTLFLLLFEKVI